MLSYARQLVGTRELFWNLTLREVRGKYRRTVLGQLWSLLNPLSSMLVYSFVFGFIFPARPAAGDPSGLNIYPLWLLSGLLPWTFFSRVVHGSLGALVQNAPLVKKVYFPRMQLPLAITASTGFTWSIELGVLTLAIWIFGGFPLPYLPLVILMMLVEALFAAGLGMILAILNVHFRDMQHLVSIALQLWMYLTPIIYPARLVVDASAHVGSWIVVLYESNPMERFVSVFRQLLYDNRFPDIDDLVACGLWGVVVFLIGYVVFARSERGIAEHL